MFKRKHRIDRTLFAKNHLKIHTPSLILLFIKNGLPYSRFGVVVSKRVDVRAVGRNRVKRMVRECLQELSQKIRTGYDMIIVVKKELSRVSKNESLEIIEATLKKGELI